MKKRILALLLSAMMLMGALVPASAADVVLGVVRYTQIVAYIDGYAIPSYNINDNTYIVVEDLAKYGFGVVWDGATGKLHISEQRTAAPANYTATYEAPAVTQAMINSEVAMNYYETKVTTWIGPNQITGYNIGGFTCICMDDLARFFAAPGGYVFVPEERALKMVSPAFGASEPALEPVPGELKEVVADYIKSDMDSIKNRKFEGEDAKLMADFKALYGSELYNDFLAFLDEYYATVKYAFNGVKVDGNKAEVSLDVTARNIALGMDSYVWNLLIKSEDKKFANQTEYYRFAMELMIEALGDDTLPTKTTETTVVLELVNGVWTLNEANNEDFIIALTGGVFTELLPPSNEKAA